MSGLSNSSYNVSDINWETVETIESVSLYFLFVLAFFTILTNGVVLLAVFMDPIQCFRTPLTFLVTGMVIADFLVGLVVEPVFISTYFVNIEDTEDQQDFINLIRASQILSTVIVNVSFLIIVLLSVCQYVAISRPKTYERVVSKLFTALWVAGIWVYAIFFALLPEITGITIYTFFMVDLYAHNVLFIVVLFVLYILMYCAYRQRTGGEWRSQLGSQSSSTHTEEGDQSRQHEKQFTKGIFILAALLAITVIPITVTLGVFFHREKKTMDQFVEEIIAYEIADLILFFKFAIDPLVYVVYFPKYREGVKATLVRLCMRCGCYKGPELPETRYTSGDRHSWGTVSDDGGSDADASVFPDVEVAGGEQRRDEVNELQQV